MLHTGGRLESAGNLHIHNKRLLYLKIIHVYVTLYQPVFVVTTGNSKENLNYFGQPTMEGLTEFFLIKALLNKGSFNCFS